MNLSLLGTIILSSTVHKASPAPACRKFVILVCAVIGVRSEGLFLAPLDIMRGRGTFETLFQNAFKYASRCAKMC